MVSCNVLAFDVYSLRSILKPVVLEDLDWMITKKGQKKPDAKCCTQSSKTCDISTSPAYIQRFHNDKEVYLFYLL